MTIFCHSLVLCKQLWGTSTQILQYQDAFQDFTPWACIYVKIQLDYTTSKISRKLINRPWYFVCLDVGFQSNNLLFLWIRPKKINQFHFLPRQDPRCPRGWAGEKAEGRAEKTDLEVEIPGSQTKDNGLKNIQEFPVIALAAPPPPPLLPRQQPLSKKLPPSHQYSTTLIAPISIFLSC